MIEFVGDEFGEDGSRLRSFFACTYHGHALPPLPWGEQQFDCVLVVADDAEMRRLVGSFAEEIVRHAVDYVQTTGAHAELLHDSIDAASVGAGVQDVVGDGRPMTAWHDDARSLAEMCEVAALCFGSADAVLCVIVGSEQDRHAFVALLRARLTDIG